MELVDFALNVLDKAGQIGMFVLLTWLWMSGRIVSRGEMDRASAGYEREKQQLREERDHARKEGAEWKFMAVRGTELAKFLGEKAAAS